MIRVRFELVPHGIESRAQEIGRIDICNDRSGTKALGNYYFTAKELRRVGKGQHPPFYPNEPREEVVTRGEIRRFPRRVRGVFDLVRLALRQKPETTHA